jgi:hypothetical protein
MHPPAPAAPRVTRDHDRRSARDDACWSRIAPLVGRAPGGVAAPPRVPDRTPALTGVRLCHIQPEAVAAVTVTAAGDRAGTPPGPCAHPAHRGGRGRISWFGCAWRSHTPRHAVASALAGPPSGWRPPSPATADHANRGTSTSGFAGQRSQAPCASATCVPARLVSIRDVPAPLRGLVTRPSSITA